MSLSTYSGIREAVSTWMKRTDLDASIPDFITLAEARLNRKLSGNVNLMNRINITFNDESRPVPDDFMGVVSLVYNAAGYGALRYMPNVEFFNAVASGQGGIPQFFTVSDGQIYVFPAPSDDTTLTLRYRIRLDALNLGPNWLIENHPDAYLFGALVEASAFMVEDERVPMWKARFEETMQEINDDERLSGFSGPLQIKSSGCE